MVGINFIYKNDITLFKVLDFSHATINGIVMFKLTLLILNVSKFSRKNEHENAQLQVLRSSYYLASVIFVPIGTLASIYIKVFPDEVMAKVYN